MSAVSSLSRCIWFYYVKVCSRFPIRTADTSVFSAIFFFQAEDGIRDGHVTGVQTCDLPISNPPPFSTYSLIMSKRFGCTTESVNVLMDNNMELLPISLKITVSYSFNSSIVVGKRSPT